MHQYYIMPAYKFACKKLICCRDSRETRGDGLLAEDLLFLVKMVMAALAVMMMMFGHRNTVQKKKSL